jgi:hypothetical protein
LTASVITLLVFSGVETLKISPTGKIQVAGAGLNYESRQNF